MMTPSPLPDIPKGPAPPVSAVGRASGPIRDGGASRVLLIDDDPGLREIISALLASFGYECHTAADGPSGLAHFADGGWDLVVTDLATPDVSGWEVVNTIRQWAPTLPVVLLTGASDPAIVRQARDCHVRLVIKPFQVSTLKAAVVEALYANLAYPDASAETW
jgi:CheY-like chemotaxis protein